MAENEHDIQEFPKCRQAELDETNFVEDSGKSRRKVHDESNFSKNINTIEISQTRRKSGRQRKSVDMTDYIVDLRSYSSSSVSSSRPVNYEIQHKICNSQCKSDFVQKSKFHTKANSIKTKLCDSVISDTSFGESLVAQSETSLEMKIDLEMKRHISPITAVSKPFKETVISVICTPDNTLREETSSVKVRESLDQLKANRRNSTHGANLSQSNDKKDDRYNPQTRNSLNNLDHLSESDSLHNQTPPCENSDKSSAHQNVSTKPNDISNIPSHVISLASTSKLLEDNKNVEILPVNDACRLPKENISVDNPDDEVKAATPVRKRGRPRKIKEPNSAPVDTLHAGRGLKRKSFQTDENLDDTPQNSVFSDREGVKPNCSVDITPTTSRKGRKPGRKSETPNDGGTPNSVLELKCMTCLQMIPNNLWSYHNLCNHNNLSWREGDKPIDVNDQKLVTRIFTALVKAKKPLRCNKCGAKKKSVLGYQSHIDQCQLSKEEWAAKKVPCVICGRMYAPISIKVHMTQAHSDKPPQENEAVKKFCVDSLPSKRPAARKAADLIQEVTSKSEQFTKDKLRRYYRAAGEEGPVFSNVLINYFGRMLKLNKKISCKIKKCDYTAENIEDFKAHLGNCLELTPQDFICKYCLHCTQSEETMDQHVRNVHTKCDYIADSDLSDMSDSEIYEDFVFKGRKSVPKKCSYITLQCFDLEKYMPPVEPSFNKIALKWTLEMIEKHYTLSDLYTEYKCLRSNWKKMTMDLEEKYKPQLDASPYFNQVFMQKEVCDVQAQRHKWKSLKLYKSTITDDTAIFFCGGRICSMAWAPTPPKMFCDQILAVSFHHQDDAFEIGQVYTTPQAIQFWNCGNLSNGNPITETPKLAYCLAHDHGLVTCMEWCPSGCYDLAKSENPKEMKRLGLLAIGCSDGNVAIYSVCQPESIGRSVKPRYFQPKESFILTTPNYSEFKYEKEKWHYQITKISWTKGKGHNVIAGGYGNGVVCIWNLSTVSPLLRNEKDGTVHLIPTHCFQPHGYIISALSLHVTAGGEKYLMTGSWDKTVKYWNLEDTTTPICVNKRSQVTDGAWFNHWLSTFISYDDMFNLGHCNSTVHNARDCNFKMTPLICQNSPVNCITVNDWLNGIAQCTLAGELYAVFPSQLLYNFEHDRTLKIRRTMISYCELVEKNISVEERIQNAEKDRKPEIDLSDKDDAFLIKYSEQLTTEMTKEESEPTSYEEANEKYGLVFCDMKVESFEKQSEEMKFWFRTSLNMRKPHVIYPFNSVNKCEWNPNYQAYLYIASGLDAGFVRLHCVRFLRQRE